MRVDLREVGDMRPVGVGIDVERKVFRGALELRRDAFHLAGEDRVPALEELFVGDGDTERATQIVEKGLVADRASLVMMVRFVDHEARGDIGWLASGMACPAGQRPGEIDVEDDAAEIEQKRVGVSGGKAGRGHGDQIHTAE